MSKGRDITAYTWYYPGDGWSAGVTALFDGEPIPDTFGGIMELHKSDPKRGADVFDVSFYGSGMVEEEPERIESVRDLERMIAVANIGLRYLHGKAPVETIYVVSFAPYEERGAVGGFDWHTTLAVAEDNYESTVEACRDSHRVRLVAMPCPIPYAPDAETRQRITDALDEDLAPIELDLPALREHVPSVEPATANPSNEG